MRFVGCYLFALVAGGCASAVHSPQPGELDDASRSLATQMLGAAERGDLARIQSVIQEAKTTGNEPDELKLLAGNVLFAVGEFEFALKEHRAAAAGKQSVRDEARLEAAIDLMALRRFEEACDAFGSVSPKLIDSASELGILRVYLNLRCGDANTALAELKELYQHGHSGAARGLARVFGQQNVFRKYRLQLDTRLRGDPGDLAAKRALGELFLCGDFANTFEPIDTGANAVRTFEELRDLLPEDCAIAGRLATARLLELVDNYRGRPPAADLNTTRVLVAKFLEPQPICSEAVEAEFLRSRLVAPDDHDARIALLEASVERLPDRPVLAYLLVQEDDAKRDHRVNRALLEPMVERSPDDWFPYARLSFETMEDNGVGATSLAWLSNGLARSPDSLALNYLSAVFLLREARYEEAVEPAARLLAGLLETGNYHHDWGMGIAILQSALGKESPAFSEWPTGEEAAAQFQSAADLATMGPGLTSAHGCFAPGSGSVAILPLWYRPELVRIAVDDMRRQQAR